MMVMGGEGPSALTLLLTLSLVLPMLGAPPTHRSGVVPRCLVARFAFAFAFLLSAMTASAAATAAASAAVFMVVP
jgi:hypothetical protein